MNVAQLQPVTPPEVSERTAKDAGEKDADFLVLRLLNKRARVRLSSEQPDLDLLPSQSRLFAVANTKGCFAAVTRGPNSNWYIISASLAQLRSAFTSSSSQSGEIDFSAQAQHALPGPANYIVYANNESRLVVALADGSLAVYDAQSILGTASANPLHVFSGPNNLPIRKLAPNPGDMAQLVAVLRDVPDGSETPAVEIFDIQQMRPTGGWRSGTTPDTKPTAITWSAKGKLIGLGLASGEIEAFSPTDTSIARTLFPRPQAMNDCGIISTSWLSNTEFYSVYTPLGPPSPDAEHTHYITLLDSKTSSFVEVKVNPPALPFPGLRPAAQFIVLMRSWGSARILMFVGDSASSDIGLLGAIADTGTQLHLHWTNLSLEETSTPTVPLDKDMNDTVLVGLEADLTGKEPYQYTSSSGEELDLPPPPVLYAYASDGTVVGWQIVHTKGMAYPGMVDAPAIAAPTSGGMDAEPTPITVSSSVVQAPAMEISTSFDNSSSVAASPMAATPSSGTSSFGFSGFTGGASKFGQPGLGFGSNNTPTATTTTTLSAPALASPMPSQRPPSPAEERMDSDNDAGVGFGSLSLGGGGGDANKDKTPSVFGSFGALANQSTSTFASASGGAFDGLKPATGFGAFGNQVSSPFGAPSAFSNPSTPSTSDGAFSALKPATGFGAFAGQGPSAFGSASAPSTSTASSITQPETKSAFSAIAFGQPTTPGQSAFEQSSFGKPAFGQPAFGQPAFGQSGFGQSSLGQLAPSGGKSSTSSGGFGAFATTDPGAMGAAAESDVKPAWTTDGSSAAARPPNTVAQPQSAFGRRSSGQPSFGQPAFGQTSAFGAGAAEANKPSPPASGGFGAFAQAGPSTFGTIPPKPNAKPVWASQPTEQSTTPKEETKPALVPITPVTPPRTPAPPASPPAVPAVPVERTEKPEVSEIPSDTSAPTPTTPGTAVQPPSEEPSTPVGGAFSRLKANPFGFGKLEAGFGAFGGAGANMSSPFFKGVSKSLETPATPAFAAGAAFDGSSHPSAGTGASKPTFGAPSALGAGRSAFGLQNTPSAKSTTTPASTPPATGGFAAFSGTTSAFSAAPNGGKSFSEMLRDKSGLELIEPVKSGAATTQTSKGSKPISVFAQLPKGGASSGNQDSESTSADPDNVSEDEEDGLSLADEDDAAFLSDSDAEGSEELGEERPEDQDSERHSNDDAEHDDDEEEEEEEEDGEEEDDDDDEGEEEDEEETAEAEPSPVKTSSTAATATTPPQSPQDAGESSTIPSLLSRLGPAVQSEQKDGLSAIPAREGSTTPPGSPVVVKPAVVPPTAIPPPTTASLGPSLGLGRPSTRPVRSSPLASKPITGDDDSSEGAPSRPGTPPFDLKARKDETSVPPTSRPKTPPLLSTFKSAPPNATPFSLAPPSKGPGALTTPTAPPMPENVPAAGSSLSWGTLRSSPSPPPPAVSSRFSAATVPQTSLFPAAARPPPLNVPSPGTINLTPSGPSALLRVPSGTLPVPGALTPNLSPGPTTGSASPVGLQSNARGPSPVPPTPAPSSPTDATGESGLQSECLYLFSSLAKELQDVKVLAEFTAAKRENWYKQGFNLADLNDPSKWRMSDLPRLQQLMASVNKELTYIKEQRVACLSQMRDIESHLLKASTRKEEIIRFDKASKDPEFARMLKTRTLGPEHMELQSRLRREIRVLRERLQQLEGQIQASKKKLALMKSQKPELRPPSLDTIKRIHRNIDDAIEEEEDQIARLVTRTASISLELTPSRLGLDHSITGESTRQRTEVSPDVAVSTAAALNAERSANKLKRALLTSRREPLLNSQATSMQPVFQEYVASTVPVKSETDVMPHLGVIADPFALDGGGDYTHGAGHRRSGTYKHAKPVQLKKSATAAASPPPAAFDWGPLRSVTPTSSSTTLPFTFSKPSPSPSPVPSLSASWVTDDFNVKQERR